MNEFVFTKPLLDNEQIIVEIGQFTCVEVG